jgi:hypothetical protein
MSKEIFQLKPNFYGVGVDLKAIYSRWKEGVGGDVEVSIISTRFQQVFAEHGVLTTSIPLFIKNLRYSDLLDERSLLAALTPEILEQTASLFGIRMAWLTGADDVVYETDYSYKNPARLLDRIGQVRRDAYNMPLRAITVSKNLDCGVIRSQRLELVAVEPIATIDETTIYRYHAFADGWDWNYPECRIQLKAMVRALGRPVPMYEVTEAEMSLAYRGALFYRSALRGALLTEPSFEDYAMTKAENRRAREVEEIPMVRVYMRKNEMKMGYGGER